MSNFLTFFRKIKQELFYINIKFLKFSQNQYDFRKYCILFNNLKSIFCLNRFRKKVEHFEIHKKKNKSYIYVFHFKIKIIV